MTSHQLIPFPKRDGSYEQGLSEFRSGQLSMSLGSLSDLSGVAPTLLKARALIRLGQPNEGLRALNGLDPSALATDICTELLLLKAVAGALVSDFDAAQDQLDLARVQAFGSSSCSVEADYHYAESFLAFTQGDYETASDFARDLLQNDTPKSGVLDQYFVDVQNSRTRARILLGTIEALNGRFDRQHSILVSALADANGLEKSDFWLFAIVLHHLSIFVRDFARLDDAVTLRSWLSALSWPENLDHIRYDIYRALGWCASLNGDELGAFRDFRLSAEIAPSTPLAVLAAVDRAFLSRELGENTNSRDQIDFAARLASNYDWENAGDHRLALAVLAQEVAATSPEIAGSLFERYRRLKTKLAPNMVNASDRRPRAYERMAEGVVLRALGRDGQATEAFLDAFEIWKASGNLWRSALAAAELADLTNSTRFIDYANAEALKRPRSWLARRCASLPAPASSLLSFRNR